jgi:hypothetical protein
MAEMIRARRAGGGRARDFADRRAALSMVAEWLTKPWKERPDLRIVDYVGMEDLHWYMVTDKLAARAITSLQHVPGDVIECGTYQGNSLLQLAFAMRRAGRFAEGRRLYACDSFQGLPEPGPEDVDREPQPHPLKHVGGYASPQDLVETRLRRYGFQNDVTLVPGWFEDTLPTLQHLRFAIIFLDVDLYESYRTCLRYLFPLLSPGGVIFFSDYNGSYWPGCNKAVDEYFAGTEYEVTACPFFERWAFVQKPLESRG